MRGEEFLRQNPQLIEQVRRIRESWGAKQALNYLEAQMRLNQSEKKPLAERKAAILKALADGRDKTKFELADLFGCSVASLQKPLESLRDEGRIIAFGGSQAGSGFHTRMKYVIASQQEARA